MYYGLTKVKYLGHLFLQKVAAVSDWEIPTNVGELHVWNFFIFSTVCLSVCKCGSLTPIKAFPLSRI